MFPCTGRSFPKDAPTLEVRVNLPRARRDALGVAILGYGYMGGMHLDALRLVDEAPVRGIWGHDPSKTREFAKKHGIKAYDSLDEVLRDKDVQIVDVCTPSHTHADFSIKALDSGKHVFVEKPLALSLRDADRMIHAAEKTRLKLMVAHVLRFFPDYMKVKEMVDAGAIGQIVTARAFRGGGDAAMEHGMVRGPQEERRSCR